MKIIFSIVFVILLVLLGESVSKETKVMSEKPVEQNTTLLNFDALKIPLYIFHAVQHQNVSSYLVVPITAIFLAFLIAPGKTKKVGEVLTHPSELMAIIQYFGFHKKTKLPKNLSQSEAWCFEILTKVSRSFAAVIIELTPELRDPICVFYLVLRGLDTIEDDMSIPIPLKTQMLKDFGKHLREPGWNSKEGYGASNFHEMKLLEHFDRVIDFFLKLKPQFQEAIEDITFKMGHGMSEFLEKKVNSCEDYNLYCHYVAGLVGIGLTRLFLSADSPAMNSVSSEKEMERLANSMGLFLQKINITRDYLEDISESPPRVFYPKEIWSQYGKRIEDFKLLENKKEALQLLNHMVTNGVNHIDDCLTYLKLVKEPSVFRFCAIPQVMAIATNERCYNNYAVFKGEVKIRKGEAVKLILQSTTYEKVCNIFLDYINSLERKIPSEDPNANLLKERLNKAKSRIHQELSGAM